MQKKINYNLGGLQKLKITVQIQNPYRLRQYNSNCTPSPYQIEILVSITISHWNSRINYHITLKFSYQLPYQIQILVAFIVPNSNSRINHHNHMDILESITATTWKSSNQLPQPHGNTRINYRKHMEILVAITITILQSSFIFFSVIIS